MKIPVTKLQPTLTLKVSGNEEWLGEIYATFPPQKGKTKPLISAELEFKREPYSDKINIQGKLSYTPFVSCSRCTDPITWPLELEVNAIFSPSKKPIGTEEEVEEALSDELDFYEITDGMMDVEPVINDAIQMAIPLQTLKKSEDLSSCLECGESLAGTKVYSDETEEKSTNPFAVLADLKVKQ